MKKKQMPTNHLKSMFFDEHGMLRDEWGLVVIVLCVAVLAIGMLVLFPSPTPAEVYEAAYTDCIASERLVADLCHEIALEAVGDD